MITRRHSEDGIDSEAVYSECGAYRYSLWRRWGPGPTQLYIMLNPSTASEQRNDPTVGRCETRARAAGMGGFAVVNLFAWRATRPQDLKSATAPVGPDNDRTITEAVAKADQVICAWGVYGAHMNRGPDVAQSLQEQAKIFHLGLTKGGHPRHPLYLTYKALPQPWSQIEGISHERCKRFSA